MNYLQDMVHIQQWTQHSSHPHRARFALWRARWIFFQKRQFIVYSANETQCHAFQIWMKKLFGPYAGQFVTDVARALRRSRQTILDFRIRVHGTVSTNGKEPGRDFTKWRHTNTATSSLQPLCDGSLLHQARVNRHLRFTQRIRWFSVNMSFVLHLDL